MPDLTIRHFGGLSLASRKTPVQLPGDFPAPLLGFLTLHLGKPVARSMIAGTLWPDLSEHRARRALSTALWRLTSVEALAPHILRSRKSVRLGRGASVWSDLSAMTRHLARSLGCASRAPRQAAARLERAIALAEGGPAFAELPGDWAAEARFTLENAQCDALFLGARIASELGCGERLNRYAARLLRLEPYREDIRRLQIEHALADGHRLFARHLYEQYVAIMEREFGERPGFAFADLAPDQPERGARPDAFGPALSAIRARLGRVERALAERPNARDAGAGRTALA
ncbi:hypothetical protein ILP92_13040 [Maribius pontilimi]|uniref:Bacterial transcriptional activator domain-containing protein n=1 Tax=Palleronia pontilimi TaxID=1964209 RepID=A0A934IIR9_9RHOB|nr:BTAD domain-containing putative transcriptional regulator [Palleronia pontilimi]MBJ3763676.1 hypothetical protein [Palleronia pontilimi]